MVVRRKKKKVRKFRGHRTYGTGSHKKARGGGSRGGRGLAGLHKHKWSYTVKYAPEHFGKQGFKRPAAVVEEIKAINLKELDQLAEKLLKEKIAVKEDEKIKIDVSKLGYEKVLGSGQITKPLIIEARYFSKSAIKKIEEAGGMAVKHE
jgi:large subunit ribosomal protein L15